MSGGKETGRQKMIGMMYLVLTALLAMNVSVTIIDKFVFLDDSLVRANGETEERNEQIVKGIAKTVDDSGNRDDDVKVVELAEEIRSETAKVLKELTELKVTLIEETGGYEEGKGAEYPGDAKHLKGKTDYNTVGHYMMPVQEGGLGYGEGLKELLNKYPEFIKEKLSGAGAGESDLEAYRPVALDADQDPVYREDPNQKGKPFSNLAFHDSPTPAGIATISEFQARILGYETRALDYLSDKVGAGDLKFDVIVPMVKPESRYVAAGTKYIAKMFIAASSSGVTPTMTYNGNEIPVDASGQGLVEFTASATNFDAEGLAKKSYEAAITVGMPGGRDTTFIDQIDYFVVKPTIQIQSTSVNALYLKCGNSLDVQVPQLGVAYNPSFSASNAKTYNGAAKGQVTIVPNAPGKVVLKVSSSGNFIGQREFGVRGIPAPVITTYTDQGEINMKTGIGAKTPRIYIKAVPDASFAEFLPDDAKFRVAEAQITLVSGGIGRKTITVGETANLAGLTAQARKGDQLSIEIRRVQRQNFRKEVEEFKNFNRFINISLN
ncbi:MAG: gliding motility protein GldM [Cyclobacteriaceae bacterium]